MSSKFFISSGGNLTVNITTAPYNDDYYVGPVWRINDFTSVQKGRAYYRVDFDFEKNMTLGELKKVLKPAGIKQLVKFTEGEIEEIRTEIKELEARADRAQRLIEKLRGSAD